MLDDLERAEAHGDLTGPFKAVADKLIAVVQKLGLEAFGLEGEPFDPAVHEAVQHEPATTCRAERHRGRPRCCAAATGSPTGCCGPAMVTVADRADDGRRQPTGAAPPVRGPDPAERP